MNKTDVIVNVIKKNLNEYYRLIPRTKERLNTNGKVHFIMCQYAPFYDEFSRKLKKMIGMKVVDLNIFDEGYADPRAIEFMTELKERLPEDYIVETLSLTDTYGRFDVVNSVPMTNMHNYQVSILRMKDINIAKLAKKKSKDGVLLYDYKELVKLAELGEILFMPLEDEIYVPTDYYNHMYKFSLDDTVNSEIKKPHEKIILELAAKKFDAMLAKEVSSVIARMPAELEEDKNMLNRLRSRIAEDTRELAVLEGRLENKSKIQVICDNIHTIE